jgi:hypothetical protein
LNFVASATGALQPVSAYIADQHPKELPKNLNFQKNLQE